MNGKIKIRIWLVFIALQSSLVMFAQTGTIRGFVFDKSNGEPIPFATVFVLGTNFGSVTDENGSFAIPKVPKGTYRIRISFVGYDSLVEDYIVGEKLTSPRRFHLSAKLHNLSGIEVSATRVMAQTETRVGATMVTPKQITQLPSIGGLPDLAQYLQVLPGVVFTGDQGGQLYLRGGTPIQNKVLLDGLTIYNPFHSIGLFSVFDVDVIKSADVYTAGFGAEYGGRISSVIDVKTRDGNRKKIAGKFDLNTFGSKLLLEGPLMKAKDDESASLTFLLSLKGSYLSQTSKWFYRYANKSGLPYDFLDGYGKISLETPGSGRINFFGFSFNDKVVYPDVATYKWNSWGTGLSFSLMPRTTNMMVEGIVAFSNYKMGLDELQTPERNSKINGLNIGMDASYLMGKSVLSYGLEINSIWTDYRFVSSYGWNIAQTDFNVELGLYLKYKWVIKSLIIEPSFRLQFFSSQSALSPEPRLAFKYNITDDIRLKFSAGLYAQNLMGVTSDQDVVNLFYGFMSVPEGVADSLNGRRVRNSLQKAQHLVAGFEFDLIPFTTVNIEGYFKNFSQLTNINRYQVFASDDEFIFETGKAYGADVSLKFEYKNLTASAVYSLNFVNRNDGVLIYRTHFDRRHNINLLLSYSWGKRNNWTVDLRWNYGTGFPFTKTKGFYPNLIINSVTGEVISVNEEVGIVLDSLNAGQLPDYHRLDFSIKRKFYLTPNCKIDVGAGLTNVYNYANIFYVNRSTGDRIYQLPLLWSLNVSVSF